MADRSIFTGISGPSTDAGDPASPIIVGHIFQVSQTCWVKSIRWWRGATSIGGVQKGRIFAVGTETVVPGTAIDFPAPSGTGWQVAILAAPVQLTANTSYKVAVHFTDNYTATGGYWASGAGVGGLVDGPLTAPDAGGVPLGLGLIPQGSFAVTSNPDLFPAGYFNGGNYWVDVILTDVDPGSAHTGTGTAPLTLAASGTGAKRATGTGTAAIALGSTRAGAKAASGVAVAALSLAATGAGTHRGVSTAVASLMLATTRSGKHIGVGTGTAALVLAASGVQPGQDLILSIGPAAVRWTVGPTAVRWTIGRAGAT